MITTSSSGFGLLDRIGARRAAFVSTAGAAASTSRGRATAEVPARVTQGQGGAGSAAVYSDPRTTQGRVRVWSSPVGQDDRVSALMARNQSVPSSHLDDQWRGLGGALLTRFGKTGADYAQSLIDDRTDAADDRLDAVAPEERAQRAADILARKTSDLAGVANGASTASLTIRTRSGQSVELDIAVNPDADGGPGTSVQLKSSGTMSTAERTAIAQLASGLDRALEGLGQADAVGLDLSGLTSYDHTAIAGLDLTAENRLSGEPLGSFALHLGGDTQSVALKGVDGALDLNVDASTSLGDTSTQQRLAAIAAMLDRMESAGERSHATPAAVEQMQSAFAALQGAATGDDARATLHGQGGTSAVDARVASRLTGLADFEASFDKGMDRPDASGTPKAAGQAHLRFSQRTAVQDTAHGARSAAQTVSEDVSADFLTASTPGGVIDVGSGNYTATHVHDSSTTTTLVDSDARRLTRALRKTDARQLETVTTLNHHMAETRSSPSQRSTLERLD